MRATLAVTIAAVAAAPALGEILHLPFHRLVNPHPAMARGLESEDLIARQFSHGGGSIHHGGSHGPMHGAPSATMVATTAAAVYATAARMVPYVPPVRHPAREVDEELVVRGIEIDDLD
ncbi:hypothetical protein EVJ58_g5890 [Rhodofomes roseus]|uniref:Uncharacterized protein n=1 Tax=Rhodofomes roseus TaxID=34475 RepID=A0A4Y9YBZ8_9APHY|nr:hypothetical protein EVJ58_g5890 [Rhodofomes roseus]